MGNTVAANGFAQGTPVAYSAGMLKLLGSFVIAKILGFGLLGAVVIYFLLSMFS